MKRLLVMCVACALVVGVGCKEQAEPVPVEAEPPGERAEEEGGAEPGAEGGAAAERPADRAAESEDPAEEVDPAEKTAEEAEVGATAPDFTLPTVEGGEETLSKHRGKLVILEWYNPDCPFVVYSHEEGPLKELPASVREDGGVWLAINSGAPGKQGAGAERNAKSKEDLGLDHPILLDEDGDVGRTYGATNTPQMVVVDAEGVIRYMGAIDNAPLGKVRGDEEVEYVTAALEDMEAGREVAVKQTEAYGCSVKY